MRDPALLIALLVAHGHNILYIPGRIVLHACPALSCSSIVWRR
jgi:hypothetical protein